MKAMIQDKYGSLEALRLRDIEMPVVKDHEVLVRVRAAGLNVGDCFGVRGSPLPVRLATGLLKPKYGVPGCDVAGHVEAVGHGVTRQTILAIEAAKYSPSLELAFQIASAFGVPLADVFSWEKD